VVDVSIFSDIMTFLMTTFEEKVKALEKIVESLSTGDISLSHSVELYKQGLTLTKELYGELKAVEKEVKLLTEDAGGLIEGSFA
jgi:exodeoxyribonuclease VII small subunit